MPVMLAGAPRKTSFVVVFLRQYRKEKQKTIELSIIIEIGSVAKQIFVAKDCPTNPRLVTTTGIWDPKVVLASLKVQRLR